MDKSQVVFLIVAIWAFYTNIDFFDFLGKKQKISIRGMGLGISGQSLRQLCPPNPFSLKEGHSAKFENVAHILLCKNKTKTIDQ